MPDREYPPLPVQPRVPLVLRWLVLLIIAAGIYGYGCIDGRRAGYERGAEAMKSAVFAVVAEASRKR